MNIGRRKWISVAPTALFATQALLCQNIIFSTFISHHWQQRQSVNNVVRCTKCCNIQHAQNLTCAGNGNNKILIEVSMNGVISVRNFNDDYTSDVKLSTFWYTTDRLLNSSNIRSLISLLCVSANTETACLGGFTTRSATAGSYCKSL